MDLYAGLEKSHLTDFDVLLSGYAPGAKAVEAVGQIAKSLKDYRLGYGVRPLFWGEFLLALLLMGRCLRQWLTPEL